MITPNKITPLRRSILHKLPILLSLINEPIGVDELFIISKKDFSDIGEFITTLNVLFILEKISLNEENGRLLKC